MISKGYSRSIKLHGGERFWCITAQLGSIANDDVQHTEKDAGCFHPEEMTNARGDGLER